MNKSSGLAIILFLTHIKIMQGLQGFDEYLEILDFEDEELLRQEVLKELETGFIIP